MDSSELSSGSLRRPRGRRTREPSPQIGRVVSEQAQARPLEGAQASESRVWLERVDHQAKGCIGEHEALENVAGKVRPLEPAEEQKSQSKSKNDFVELDGMAPNAVAEIYTPGQGCWNAIGIVSQAGEEAPQASNRNPEAEWHGKEVTSALLDPTQLLGQLDGK